MYIALQYFTNTPEVAQESQQQKSSMAVLLEDAAFSAVALTPLSEIAADEARAKRMAREVLVKDILAQIRDRFFSA